MTPRTIRQIYFTHADGSRALYGGVQRYGVGEDAQVELARRFLSRSYKGHPAHDQVVNSVRVEATTGR